MKLFSQQKKIAAVTSKDQQLSKELATNNGIIASQISDLNKANAMVMDKSEENVKLKRELNGIIASLTSDLNKANVTIMDKNEENVKLKRELEETLSLHDVSRRTFVEYVAAIHAA